MNCAYRLIWNEQLSAWVVAPEIASARGKRSQVKRSAAALMLTLAIGAHAALAADLAATALPGGGQVSAGQATISSTGAAMTINQGSQRAIINWQNFDIGSQASVNFQQPNTSAVTLNRAGGPTASRIEGQLTANGQVFLINPNGVLFGGGARVNVGGLVASTLNIRDADFLSGNYIFSGNGGSITNQGQITAAPGGYLAFISPSITNNGTISAPQGTVAMGAGERVRLNFAGDRLVGLDVSADTIDTLITNNQAIRADGGAILLTAAGAEAVTRSVINNTGVLEAGSLTQDGGRIVLTAGNDINLGTGSTVAVNGKKGGEITVQAQGGTLLADGSITARGAGGTGGNVQLLGHQVGLVNAATVDASGETGGGTVLVGGDYQGKNPEIQNASRTYVSSGVTIKADANAKGDGGKVVVWADGDTRYYGAITARGGARGGDGGFVEVSGKQNLDFHGRVDVTAPLGIGGNVLLDPEDIVLNTTAQTPPLNNIIGTPDVAFMTPPVVGTYTIEIADVTGFNELFLQATRDITISSPLVMAPSNTIRFEANNNINVNAAITTSVAPSTARPAITLTADADNSGAGTLAIAAALSSGKGGLALSGASVTSTAAGSITSTGIAGASGGNVSITGTSAAGTINLAGAIVSTGGTAGAGTAGRNAGNVTINGAGAVTTSAITANGTAGSGTNQAGGNGAAISITGVGGVTTAALVASGGTATTTNGNGGNAGSIAVTNSGSGNIATTTLTALTGAATGTGAGGTAGSISVTNTAAGGNITTTNISTLGTNNSGGGNVLLSSQGNVTVNGTIGTSAGGNTSLTAGRKAGNITITGVNRSISGVMTANGGIASGTNQAGGDAGMVSVTGTGTLSTAAINSRTGTATGTGAGGTVGGITLSGTNVTTGGLLDTSGRENGDGGNININATGLLTLNGALRSTGGANVAATTQAGNNAGTITLSGNGIVSSAATATITANGGAGLGANQAGGNAGLISISGTGTGAIALNTGAAITSSTGAATGTGAGGAVGGITLNGPSITSTGALTTTGGANGNGGNVSATTTTGNLSVVAITTTGGAAVTGTAGRNAGTVTISGAGTVTTAAITANGTVGNGTNQAGGNAGSIAVTNSGSGNIATTTLTALTGAATGTGAGGTAGSISVTNTAAGGNITTTNISTLGTNNSGGGNVLLSSQGNVTVNGTIGTSAGGNTSLTAGRKAGNITITGVNRSISGVMTANGGIASGTNQAGGDAGMVSVTGTGTLSTAAINSRTGTATGTGAGGTVGGITLSGTNVTTGGLLDTSGRENGDGGNININATGLLTLNGALRSTGGANVAATTQAGNNAGTITLSGNGIVSSAATATITANGGAGLGANQAGGNAGLISISGTGTGAIALNTGAAITSSTGAATGTGAGGAVGGITLNGPSITSTGALTTTGGANGNGGNVSATTTTGNLSVVAITTTGGAAVTGTAGRNAGTVTISGAGTVTTAAITANGTVGNGTNQAGGNAGSISLDAGGATPLVTIGGNLSALGGDRTGTGAAGTGGNITVADTLNIGAANRTVSSRGGSTGVGAGGNITLGGPIYDDGGVRSLTVTGGSGTVTVTGGAANATLGNNVDTLVVTASDGAGKIRVGSVKTVAAQSYDAGTGGIELNGDVVTLGSAGADTVTFSDPVTLTGNSSITTAGGSGDNIAINQTVNGAFSLTLNAGASGNVSTSAIIGGSTPLTSFSATGAAVTLGQSVTAGSIFARSTTGNVTLNAPAVLTGTGIGNAIELVAGGAASRFINNAGAGALNASNAAGRFLVWSQNPANDTRGGLAYAFKQYNATYGVTPVAQATGNGFLYSLAPAITPGLTGTVSKVYDTTTSAPLVASNFTPTSGVDGDVIALSGTGTYDDPNVAGSPTKLVTATGIAATVTSSIADGSKPVYGYTLTSTTANANIGEITPAPLTINGNTTSSLYTSNLQTNNFTTSGLLGSDTVTSVATLASGTNVGTYADNLTSATGSGLGNYIIGYVNGSLTITPAPLTITGNTTSSLYTSNLQTNNFTTSGLLGSDTVTSVATLASGTNVGTYADNLTSATGSGLGNYIIGYVNGSLTITPAPLTITGNTTSSLYTSNLQTNNFTTSGLLGSDTVTSVATLASGTNVGTYADNLTSATGSGLGNYIIGYVNGSLTITPAPLTITGNTTSSLYTSNLQTNNFTTSGLLGSDTVTSVATLASGTNVGTYTDNLTSASGTGLANYTIGYVNGSLTITPAPLTITGDTTSSLYTSNLQTNTFTTSGLLGSDSVTSIATLASGTNVGTYTDNLTSASGTGLANYTIGFVNGSLTITPAPLTITANDAQRPVDTPNPPFSATYAGFVGGETPAVLNGALAFSTLATIVSPAGTYPITPYGQSSGNYTITYLDGKLTIQGTPVVAPPFPRDVISQQAIGAQYTDPTMSLETLTDLQFTFDDKHDGKDEKVAASVVRVVGSGIRLPN